MKRDIFAKVGMFDETLVAGEDFDLHNRIVEAGYKWAHVDAIEIHLGEPKDVKDVWKKFFYYGRTIQRYRKKNKEISKVQFLLFRPSFKKIQKQLRPSPKLFIYFYLYLFIKYTAGLCGMLIGPPKSLK